MDLLSFLMRQVPTVPCLLTITSYLDDQCVWTILPIARAVVEVAEIEVTEVMTKVSTVVKVVKTVEIKLLEKAIFL